MSSTGRRLAAVVALFLLAAPLHADFSGIARALASQRGVQQRWMPFLGLARFAVWIVRPAGVHDFQLATFTGAERLDPHQLDAIVRKNADRGFTPFVKSWSRRTGEWSFVYARPAAAGSNRVELMVLSHDDEDTVLVRVDVDTEMVAREMKRGPREITEVARR